MIGPLSLDPLIRDTWGSYNPLVMAQLAPLAYEDCYKPKFYRIPDPQDELMAAGAYVEFGFEVTPGSLLFGFLVPPSPLTALPPQFTFMLSDDLTGHKFMNEPIPSVLLSNYHPCVLDLRAVSMSCFWNLLDSAYPVIGEGRFTAQIQSTAAITQRIEVILGAFEVRECR